MNIKISNGELLDRISILELKKLRMKDAANLAVVEKEFLELNKKCVNLFTKNDSTLQVLYLELARINGKLWDLENKVRSGGLNDKEFIIASKKIFKLNGQRSNFKNDINLITGSDGFEAKEYDT
jgi:uncharacterized protein YxjI|tara:strand:- start:7658 stop:8029 length:372 start_codon:yes stop_codon:yes gene_type:complete